MPEIAGRVIIVMALYLSILVGVSACSASRDSMKFLIAYSTAANQALAVRNVNHQDLTKTVVEEKESKTKQGLERSTTTTTTTETSYLNTGRSVAVTQKTVCPDADVYYIAGKDSAPPKISPCVATIVESAIDYCVEQSLSDNIFDQTARRLSAGGSAVTAGAGAAIAAAAGANPALGSAVGAGAALLNSSNIPFITNPSGQPGVDIDKMIKAGQQYVQLQNGASLMRDPNAARQYYAGLWNVVGSACPEGLFRAAVPERNGYYVQKIEGGDWAVVQGGETWSRFGRYDDAITEVDRLACAHRPAEAIVVDDGIERRKYDVNSDYCLEQNRFSVWNR